MIKPETLELADKLPDLQKKLETLELADKLPDLQKKLVEHRSKNQKARVEEEERHNKALEALAAEDGNLSYQVALAARARQEVMREVPFDLKKAADNAGSEYRDAAHKIKYEREQRVNAAEKLEGCTGPEEEQEALRKQLERVEGDLKKAEKNLTSLKAKQEAADKAVEACVAKIRKEVLAGAKAERAGRG